MGFIEVGCETHRDLDQDRLDTGIPTTTGNTKPAHVAEPSSLTRRMHAAEFASEVQAAASLSSMKPFYEIGVRGTSEILIRA